MIKVVIVFGTRPEAIKMCPLVLELNKCKEIQSVVCVTGQHREMLDQVLNTFDIDPDYNLEIMKNNQTLTDITSSVLKGMEQVLIEEKPQLVLVHGDTTTSYATALAAFYRRIPVGHVEAGLRTGDIYSPFPEEMNRLLTDRISTYFFAPTKLNEKNLNTEGISNNVFVTGNTVIDAFRYTVSDEYVFNDVKLNTIAIEHNNVVVVTAHRRENWGKALENICNSIMRLAIEYKDMLFVYPVHLNPQVKGVVYEMLSGIDNVLLLNPLSVLDMHNLLAKCYMVMTDSGGLQEEAPHFGKPVLVLRQETERPEAVEAGTVKVVGTDERNIYIEAKKLLDDKDEYRKMAIAVNPYGDGHACERIVKIIETLDSNKGDIHD